MKQLITLLALVLLTCGVRAQQPPIAACMTNLTIYAHGTASVGVGLGANQYNQIGGMSLISASCSADPNNVQLEFYANCCPTSSIVVATVAWECDDDVKCGGGEGGAGTCGTGGHLEISLRAGESSIYGYLKSSMSCCGLVWCPGSPITCTGQGWPACDYSNGQQSITNSPD
jgi:hypothetical protein